MYSNASTYDHILDLSWDLIVISLLILSVFYIFGHMMMATGLPQYYFEQYAVALTSVIIGYQVYFYLLFYSGKQSVVSMYGLPIMELDDLSSGLSLKIIIVLLASSFFVFLVLLFLTTFILAYYMKFFREQTELRYNKELIPPFLKTMAIIFIVSILAIYFNIAV
ncbi:hypothetical protein MZM54_02175 [[Brevibacterium] frigoritolerans]|nr:hypothetical protein [Peribacillus frigoritolerans]